LIFNLEFKIKDLTLYGDLEFKIKDLTLYGSLYGDPLCSLFR